MFRFFSRAAAVAAVLLALALPAGAYAPAPVPRLPVGRWTVRFANGVVQTCEVREDGTASVREPRRSSAGKAEARGGAIVITFRDDRLERWTVRGKRVVVEHWFPASQYPSGPRVLGVATRSP
jgi:hypothetical protein